MHTNSNVTIYLVNSQKLVENRPFVIEVLSRNENLDIVNINAFAKFGVILSICSEDTERKRNSDIDQGP